VAEDKRKKLITKKILLPEGNILKLPNINIYVEQLVWQNG